MELKDAVYGRRSVRKYKAGPIDRAVLEEVLDAALWAPSGSNLQPWYFVVLTDPERMARLREMMASVSGRVQRHLEERYSAHPEVIASTTSFISTLGGAPAAVLAFRDKPDYSLQLQDEGVVQSVSAAVENLLLSAHDHGLGSCWLTAPGEAGMCAAMRDEFAPGHGELVCLVTLGYAEEGHEPKAPRRKPDKYVII